MTIWQNIKDTRTQKISPRQISELIFLAIMLFTIPIGLARKDDALTTTNFLLIFSASFVLYCTNLYFILKEGKMDIMSPIFFFSVIFFLAYLVPLENFLNGSNSMFIAWPYRYYDYEDSLERTFIIILLMSIAF